MVREDHKELVEELCKRFEQNVEPDPTFSSSDVRELLFRLFGRFENPPYIYFSVNTGWFNLLDSLHKKLYYLDPHYTIFQIKEKFGSMRFYASFSDISPIAQSICFDLVDRAEIRSSNVCEICGKYGQISEHKHWLSARCNDHRNIIFDF